MDFWFDFASTYSYVAALRVEGACAQAGIELRHRPFLLGPIFTELLGIKDSPFNVHLLRGAAHHATSLRSRFQPRSMFTTPGSRGGAPLPPS